MFDYLLKGFPAGVAKSMTFTPRYGDFVYRASIMGKVKRERSTRSGRCMDGRSQKQRRNKLAEPCLRHHQPVVAFSYMLH